MIALIGITIERKVTSSRRNASPKTKAKISGSLLFSWLAKSWELAASPLTLTVVPSTLPTVAGMISSRSSLRASTDGASVPLPGVGTLIWATVPSSL